MDRRSFLELTAAMAAIPGVPAAAAPQAPPATRVRARGLGIATGEMAPGPLNAITDVAGVLVGHATIVRGDGPLSVGVGPVRTGVTAVLPHRDVWKAGVLAATHTLNGDGELTGVHWIRDLETLASAVLITNTGSVGAVHEAAIRFALERHGGGTYLPVVGETWDGRLNDIAGFHVTREHVYAALDGATSGPVAEGNVGGGTGMVCYGFKGGIGTASRRLPAGSGGFTVGALLQANFGRRSTLTIDGVPVGREMPLPPAAGWLDAQPQGRQGSVIVVLATDAPVSSRQLERMCRRATLGLARTGTWSGNGSGDIFVGFSTANQFAAADRPREQAVRWYDPGRMDPLFQATVEAVEEAVLNALTKAETMTGINGTTVEGVPYGLLRQVRAKYGRGPG
jgi:L-aminopeptidase/D-esterase-like protein